MKRLIPGAALWFSMALWPTLAPAFCGFYVARGDAQLFNQASQVVMVRDEDRTVITMSSDFKGEPSEFAVVIPVPTFIEKGQIHIGEKALIDHLDAFSAPRLVEYFDENPCGRVAFKAAQLPTNRLEAVSEGIAAARARSLGVTIEARYTVGEYDILILSARQSAGLETWLRENGYRIPTGASAVLGSYLKQGMRFFVAKVNLKEQSRLGFSRLRPIQVAYESPKFMLPIRLGMVNAQGPQELLLYVLTRKGRVETTNYRTVRLPSDVEVPEYVKDRFADFYRALFARQVRQENMEAVFLEYFWNMSWCDPCASDPLSRDELRQLGVSWLEADPNAPAQGGLSVPGGRILGGPVQAFVTRLHLRYDGAHFPEDLVFQETADQTNFQARYILRHPWRGAMACPEAQAYRDQLRQRHQDEARTLASLTGWRVEEIRERMKLASDWSEPDAPAPKWWETLWKN